MRINNLIPENTEGFGGEKPPSEEISTNNAKKQKGRPMYPKDLLILHCICTNN